MTRRARPAAPIEEAHIAGLEALVRARDTVQGVLDERVVAAVLGGVPYDVVARIIGVSKPTMFNRYGSLETLRRQTGKDRT